MKIQIVLALIFSVILITESRPPESDESESEETTPGEKVIQSIPEHERKDFISYALGHGFMDQFRFRPIAKFPFPKLLQIPDHLEEKFQAVKKPENFTSDLYLFVKSTYKLTSPDMFALILFKKYCFPTGRCVDLENIGELCCPF